MSQVSQTRPDADPDPIGLAGQLAPFGARLALTGKTPRRCDTAERAALVLSGSVELFLVAMRAGEPVGARHHFATLPPGSLLLGADAAALGLDMALLAVGPIGTELLECAPAALERLAATPEGAALMAPALDLWIQALLRGLARWVSPRPDIEARIAPGESATVRAGQRFTVRGGVGWVRVAPNDCLLLDMQELADAADERLFPLSGEGWLTPLGARELTVVDTRAALLAGAAWPGLALLHRLLFDLGALNLRFAAVDEHNRLRARLDATAAQRARGLAELRAAVDVRAAPVPEFLDEPPLAAAVRLIGREQGFEVQPPAPVGGEAAGAPPTLTDLARASGFRVRAVSPRDRWWTADFGTLLAFDRDSGQPRVLGLDARGRPRIRDPHGHEITPFARQRERLADTAWQLSGALPARSLDYRTFFRFGLRGRAPDLLATLATGALLGVLGLAIPVTAGLMIDQAIPDRETGRLIELALALAVLGATGFVLTYVNLLGYARVEAHLGRALQAGLMDRLLRLPLRFFKDYAAGELANRVGAVAMIQGLISMTSANAILSGIFSVFSFGLMFLYDARLALWASLAVLVYVAGSVLLLWRRLAQERPLAALHGALDSTLLQLILGVSKIRLAAAEDRAFARWARLFAQARRHRIEAERLGALQDTLNEAFALAGLFLFVLAIGQPSEAESLVALGAFAALLIAFQRFAAGLTQMTQVLTQLLAIQPQLERARPLLEAEPETVERREDPGPLAGALEICDARFRYAPDGPPILDGVSLQAAPGEMIAIVGPSGSGKSTLMRLLLGFETLESGAILIDGKELNRLDPVAVRRQMGVVLQGTQPLPGSLHENIVGAAGGSLEDAWEAAERVGLAEEIRAMPMGMHTMILEGGNALSGGQVQRLTIARALVGRPRILLFDEATSALDNRTQATVTASLARLGITRIIVAHRLSTVIDADRIYVLVNGRIVEIGRYEELIAADGFFADLARRQMA